MNNDAYSIAYHPRIYQYDVQVAMILVHHISIDDEDVPMALASHGLSRTTNSQWGTRRWYHIHDNEIIDRRHE